MNKVQTTLAPPGSPESDPALPFTEALIRRFDRSGPRYTSYPTADRFQADYPQARYGQLLQDRATLRAAPPLSVYVHLPFCESLCYFCACNKIITRDHGKAADYLQDLFQEIEMVSGLLGRHREMVQLHLGGGTPTFLSSAELTVLMNELRAHLDFSPDAELGVEIDPRTVNAGTLQMLAGLGFNRTSFGVQDFDPRVQKAVNRIQPYDLVCQAMDAARDAGFASINTDLIYGLPKQTLDSFSTTLDRLVGLSPDRIALYNYAHLPGRFKAQRLIHAEDLPSAETRLQIFMMSLRRLLDAGYVYIGLDHFAKPGDELSQARASDSLHRNFQGYTTRAGCDLIGLGISAIGKIGHSYIQNQHMRKPYADALARGELPVSKGFDLDADDVARRELIMAIMCCTPVDISAFEQRHRICFERHFRGALERLQPHVDAGLLTMHGGRLEILPEGRLFVRALAMEFDTYLGLPRSARYSKLI